MKGPRLRTRGEYEAELLKLFMHSLKKTFGRGASQGRVLVIQDLVIFHASGVLHSAEQRLALQPESPLVAPLMRVLRHELVQASRQDLQKQFEPILGVAIASIFSDLDIVRGEAVMVLRLEKPVYVELQESDRDGGETIL